VLSDPALAADMRRKGLLRARQFSWEQSVTKTWEMYQEIGARRQQTADTRQETAGGAAVSDVTTSPSGSGAGEEDASERSATLP
jgi:hypothetical protein